MPGPQKGHSVADGLRTRAQTLQSPMERKVAATSCPHVSWDCVPLGQGKGQAGNTTGQGAASCMLLVACWEPRARDDRCHAELALPAFAEPLWSSLLVSMQSNFEHKKHRETSKKEGYVAPGDLGEFHEQEVGETILEERLWFTRRVG